MSRPCRCAALLSALVLGLAVSAAAQDARAPAAEQAKPESTRASRILRFLAGGAAGLIVHEGGHLAAGFVFDANPGFKRLDYGVIPFFIITHDPVSRRREYLISSSGFLAQHAANEWLLGGPPLGSASAPFKKGWLTFNLAASAVYTAAALGRFGPLERDTRGMALNAGRDGMPEQAIGVLILVPAVLDGVRYLKDDPAWARWASRAVKAGLVLLAIK